LLLGKRKVNQWRSVSIAMTETQKALIDYATEASKDHEGWAQALNRLVDSKYKSGNYGFSREEMDAVTALMWASEKEMAEIVKLGRKYLSENA
jgi:hypothetical protein